MEPDKLRLVRLIEECSEVQKIATKILRFGWDDFHPKTKEYNRELLALEIGDLQFEIGLLIDNGNIDIDIIVDGAQNRKQKIEEQND